MLAQKTYFDYLDFIELSLDLIAQVKRIIIQNGDPDGYKKVIGNAPSHDITPDGKLLSSASAGKVALWGQYFGCLPRQAYERIKLRAEQLKQEQEEQKRLQPKQEEERRAGLLRIKREEEQWRREEEKGKREREERKRRLNNGLCLVCGQKLGFFDKIAKRTSHKSCLNT